MIVFIEKLGELIRVLGEGNEGVRLLVLEKIFFDKNWCLRKL